MAGKKERRRKLARERYERQQARRAQRAHRWRLISIIAAACAAVVLLGGAAYLTFGTGGGNLGAPDLSAEGSKKNATTLQSYVADPSKFGNTVMPKFASFASIPAKDAQGKDLGISQLRALAT